MDRTEADSLFFLSGDRVKLGGLELAVGDSTGYVRQHRLRDFARHHRD